MFTDQNDDRHAKEKQNKWPDSDDVNNNSEQKGMNRMNLIIHRKYKFDIKCS